MRALLAAVGIATLVAGCQAAPGSRARDPERQAQGVMEGPFGALGTRMRADRVPGVSLAVIDGYDIAWVAAYGLRNAEAGEPITPDTLFLASSISKGIAAAVALQLVDQGLLGLDEPVNDRLVSWRVPDNVHTQRTPVTLRQLLGHAACINRPEGGFGHEAEYPTTKQVLDGQPPATNQPARVECVPGSELRYSNFGYVIVQQLIEDVTGMPFPDVAESMVLAPIGMTSSTFREPLASQLEARAANPHDLEGRVRPLSYNPNAVAQGGLWTTPSDLARFAVEVMRSRAGRATRGLPPEVTRQMLTPQYRELEGGLYWGLGFLVLGDWAVLQAGSDPGFRSLLAAFPTRGQGIAVMLNGEGGELLQLRLLLNFIVEYVLVPIRGRVIAGGLAVVFLLSAVVLWPIGGLVWVLRRRRRDTVPVSVERARRARAARVLAVLAAVAILGTAYPYVTCAFDPLRSRLPVLAAIAVCGALSIAVVFLAARGWREGSWTLAGRIHFSLVALAAVVGSVLWIELVQLL